MKRLIKRMRRWLYESTHRPVDVGLYEEFLLRNDLDEKVIPVAVMEVVIFLDEEGRKIVAFRAEDTNGELPDLDNMLGWLAMAGDTAREVASHRDE